MSASYRSYKEKNVILSLIMQIKDLSSLVELSPDYLSAWIILGDSTENFDI